MTVQVFLLNTGNNVAYWPDPGDWNNDNNTVVCIGSGGNGVGVWSGGGLQGGGGGGACGFGSNLVLTFPVPYSVPQGGIDPGGGMPHFSTFATNFNLATNAVQGAATANTVSAGCGTNAFAGNGGVRRWPNGFNGGNGGIMGNTLPNQALGTGGGGAGGTTGGGFAGSSGNTGSGTGIGGAANVPVGMPGGNAGSNGNSGTEFDATHGSGSGGGGANGPGVPGGNGGQYGGGGAMGWPSPGTSGGIGGDGLISITYEPPALVTLASAIIMA